MVEINGEDLLGWEKKSRANEEKIFVTVRIRPLNAKELAQKDVSDWECINDNTIIFKNTIPERSLFPTAYTFDRVFGSEASTQNVYEEGAKDVALSVLSGLNSTIFAYGQTSSGKTYTMRGITDLVVVDIYNYIERHEERLFVLKFSAMEIYNEVVKDLLSSDGNPLRLLDDPERGTVVEKLVEETVKDKDHLQKLLDECEAQRQVGETSLNETSSRSHQILRLTIESSVRESLQEDNSSSLLASLNFVDLAGSERASQAFSVGARLKEGCHINRSLLTLGTVIRKLSGSNRIKNGHIPYRDSKLTRILQNALGGNARTAIICTMSPARSHVEQSKNTLLFASCAKEVATSAHVNVVMSDKALVKHLQKEVARLENELRFPVQFTAPHHAEALLRQKELQIQKMEKEMEELIQQRDTAQSRLDNLLRIIGNDTSLKRWESLNLTSTLAHRMNSYEEEGPLSDMSSVGHEFSSDEGHTLASQHCNGERNQGKSEKICPQSLEKTQEEAFLQSEERQLSCVTTPRKQPVRESTSNPLMLVQEIRKLEHLQEELGKDASRALETLQKEVQCIHLAKQGTDKDTASVMMELTGEIRALCSKEENQKPPEPIALRNLVDSTLKDEISRLNGSGDLCKLTDTDATIAALEQQLENVQKSIENLIMPIPSDAPASPLSRTPSFRNETPLLTRSRSCRAQIMAGSPSSSPCHWACDSFEHNENTPPRTAEKAWSKKPGSLRKRLFHKNSEKECNTPSREGISSPGRSISVDIKKMQNMFKAAAEENINSIRSYVTELKERVAKLQYQKQLLVCQVMDLEANGHSHDDKRVKGVDESPKPAQSPLHWPLEFDKQRKRIIELWDSCYVSITHRTRFFLLFKGDHADAIYMEVELRRLSFLQKSFCSSTENSPTPEDEQNTTLASSIRALKREREMLARQMQRRLTAEERELLFQKWGVALDTKQRKLQLAHRLWTDSQDLDHIQESANLVAKLVGFWEPGQASKEMFELNFTPRKNNQRLWSSSWNPISTLLSF